MSNKVSRHGQAVNSPLLLIPDCQPSYQAEYSPQMPTAAEFKFNTGWVGKVRDFIIEEIVHQLIVFFVFAQTPLPLEP